MNIQNQITEMDESNHHMRAYEKPTVVQLKMTATRAPDGNLNNRDPNTTSTSAHPKDRVPGGGNSGS